MSVATRGVLNKGYGAWFEGAAPGGRSPAKRCGRPATFILTVRLVSDVRILECPQCHGVDLYYEAGLITGYKYHCKTCNYIGAFVIQREVEGPEH